MNLAVRARYSPSWIPSALERTAQFPPSPELAGFVDAGALGFAVTLVTLGSGYGFNPLEIGPWVAWPDIGGPDVDPYARAVISRSG